jgi:hypothetical protein
MGDMGHREHSHGSAQRGALVKMFSFREKKAKLHLTIAAFNIKLSVCKAPG